jgi:hypothetical protein
MTRIQRWTLDREEKLTEAFALPHGRRVEAVLHSLSVARSSGAHPEGERVALMCEVKAAGADDFAEVACTPWLAVGPEESSAKLVVPTKPEPLQAGQHPGTFRLRLVHEGRLQPHVEVQVLGI